MKNLNAQCTNNFKCTFTIRIMDNQNILSAQYHNELMNEYIGQSSPNPTVSINGFFENENHFTETLQDDVLVITDISKFSIQSNNNDTQISFDNITELKEAELRSLLSQWNLEHLAEVCIGIYLI